MPSRTPAGAIASACAWVKVPSATRDSASSHGRPMSSSSALFGAANLRDLNEISAKQFGDGANICGKVSGSSD